MAYEELLAWKKAAKAQSTETLTECPECGWEELEHSEDGSLSCPFCGWHS